MRAPTDNDPTTPFDLTSPYVMAHQVATAVETANSPDADLIRICAEHKAAMEEFNASELDSDKTPLWDAYMATIHAIDAAKLETLAGLIAKARAAKTEARQPGGNDRVLCSRACTWAWDVVNDLLRLNGGAA